MMHLTSVLFPAPFSPSNACTDPEATLMDTLSKAVIAPKRFVMPTTSRSMPCVPRAFMIGPSCESLDELGGVGDAPEDPTLHLHHLDRMIVVRLVRGTAAVLQQETLEA